MYLRERERETEILESAFMRNLFDLYDQIYLKYSNKMKNREYTYF